MIGDGLRRRNYVRRSADPVQNLPRTDSWREKAPTGIESELTAQRCTGLTSFPRGLARGFPVDHRNLIQSLGTVTRNPVLHVVTCFVDQNVCKVLTSELRIRTIVVKTRHHDPRCSRPFEALLPRHVSCNCKECPVSPAGDTVGRHRHVALLIVLLLSRHGLVFGDLYILIA